MCYIRKRHQAANQTVFEVCWSLICPHRAVVRGRRLSQGVLCPVFDTRSLVFITCGGCNHKGCHWDVFPLITRTSTLLSLICTLIFRILFYPHIFVSSSPPTLQPLFSWWQMVRLCTGKEASLMSTQSFLTYLVFQWRAVNLTVSKWEE